MTEVSLMAEDLRLNKEIGDGRTPITSLVVRAQAGDREAFDQLMVCHQHRIVSLAWRMLGNREEARDAAQETFLRVYRHLGKFDPDRDFGAWLYRIAVNVCRDQAKRRNRGESVWEEDRMARHPSPENVEQGAIDEQERRLALQALAELTEKERAALVLRDLEGFDTDEVARLLGSTPTTVRSQISKARVKLKNLRARWRSTSKEKPEGN